MSTNQARSTSRARTSSSSSLVESKIEAEAKCRPPAPATGRVRALSTFTRWLSRSQRVERTSRPRRTCWAGHATCSRIPCLWPVSSPGRTQCLLLGVPPLWRRWAGKTHGVGGMTCAAVGSQAGGCQRVRSARAAPRRCVPHVCALASSTRSALPQRARPGETEFFLNADGVFER